MEIPNNGADDYAFSAVDMIGRFDQNFTGQPLLKPAQVTYLSHPQWFDTRRQAKMTQLFDYLDQYRSAAGTGPVVYTTLNGVYEAFKLYLNGG
jgi:hypothetical protein